MNSGNTMLDDGFLASPVIVTGCQRSGTTLLRTMLGRHPELLEHPDEPQFILNLYERQGKTIRNIKSAVSYITVHPYAPESLSTHLLKEEVQTVSQLTLRNLVQTYVKVWAAEYLKTKRPLLKDPAFIFHLPLVTYLFPQAKIIHIVRDPRANVSSQINRWPQITVWEAAMMWKKAVTGSRQWSMTNSHQYIEVTYEELVQHPAQTLQSICQFLQIPYKNSLLNFEQETTQYSVERIPKQVTHQTTDPSRLYIWKSNLTPIEIRLIEQCCREEMKLWQYLPLNPTTPAIHYRIRLIREQAYYAFKMAGKFVKAIWRKLLWRLGLME